MDDYEFSNVSRINSPPRNSEHVTVQLDTEQEPATGTQSLPPCDSGSAAWRLLLSAFVFEALLWGASIPILFYTKLSTTNTSRRLPSFFWCLPGLLFQPSPI